MEGRTSSKIHPAKAAASGSADMDTRRETSVSGIYELRLLFTSGEKREYTVEEITELLDKIAAAKDQE